MVDLGMLNTRMKDYFDVVDRDGVRADVGGGGLRVAEVRAEEREGRAEGVACRDEQRVARDAAGPGDRAAIGDRYR